MGQREATGWNRGMDWGLGRGRVLGSVWDKSRGVRSCGAEKSVEGWVGVVLGIRWVDWVGVEHV